MSEKMKIFLLIMAIAIFGSISEMIRRMVRYHKRYRSAYAKCEYNSEKDYVCIGKEKTFVWLSGSPVDLQTGKIVEFHNPSPEECAAINFRNEMRERNKEENLMARARAAIGANEDGPFR